MGEVMRLRSMDGAAFLTVQDPSGSCVVRHLIDGDFDEEMRAYLDPTITYVSRVYMVTDLMCSAVLVSLC